jgi:hypothetical protein
MVKAIPASAVSKGTFMKAWGRPWYITAFFGLFARAFGLEMRLRIRIIHFALLGFKPLL